jgi:hypothetical protein
MTTTDAFRLNDVNCQNFFNFCKSGFDEYFSYPGSFKKTPLFKKLNPKPAAVLIFIFPLLALLSCSKTLVEEKDQPFNENLTILNQLALHYEQLPERVIHTSPDGRFYAQYAKPTTAYHHAILGDAIEGKQLVFVADSIFYEILLEEDYVFEDIAPRIMDIDGDGRPEIITIRTHKSYGAGIAIYKAQENGLSEFARVKEIGTRFRWLNIVAIADLDNDGITELAWIETPHIGGTLKIAKIKKGILEVVDEAWQFSNHAIGERNLCLSVLSNFNRRKTIYVPNQSRTKIVGFTFDNNKLEIADEIDLNIDFARPLNIQYHFSNKENEGNHCD